MSDVWDNRPTTITTWPFVCRHCGQERPEHGKQGECPLKLEVVFERARITTEIEALRIYGIASGESLLNATDGGWNRAIAAVLAIVNPEPGAQR